MQNPENVVEKLRQFTPRISPHLSEEILAKLPRSETVPFITKRRSFGSHLLVFAGSFLLGVCAMYVFVNKNYTLEPKSDHSTHETPTNDPQRNDITSYTDGSYAALPKTKPKSEEKTVPFDEGDYAYYRLLQKLQTR